MPSNITWNGAIPWEDVPYEIDFDAFGVGSSTIHIQFEFNDPAFAAAQVAGINTHPAFTWLKRSKGKIQREEANFARAQITFEGIPPDTDERHYKLKGSLATESIQTNPSFQEWLDAGLVEVESGGAITWNDEDEDQSFQGVESWLVPNLIYEETWIRGSKGGARDFSKLGKKETPPPSDARPGNIGGGRDFLFLGGDIEIIGYGSKMTRRWRLSGPRGWNKKIYG